ncbi:TonB family protein [Gammaproteobacteria bacterium]|nr:TonB family protein [Gammaproteobacteria bacterium]
MNNTTIMDIALTILNQHQWLGYLLNVLAKSTAIFLAIIVLSFLFRKYSAAARHLIWCVAILSFLVLPLIVLFVPRVEIEIPENTIITSPQSENFILVVNEFSHGLENWSSLILVIYFTVMFTLVAYTILGLYRVQQLTVSAQALKSNARLKELQVILNQEGIFSDIEILETEVLTSPLSWGLRKPVILMPSDSAHWTIEKVRNVLIHEVCHIQRLDWLSHLLSRLTIAIYWFNPLIWYAVRKLGEEAEQACDDAVLLYGRNQSEYANDLLEIAKNVTGTTHKNLIAEAIAHSFLGSRVIAILDSGKSRNKTESVWVVRALLAMLSTVVIVASLKIVPEVNLVALNNTFRNTIPVTYLSADEPLVERRFIQAVAEKPVMEEIVFGVESLSYASDVNEQGSRVVDYSSDSLDPTVTITLPTFVPDDVLVDDSWIDLVNLLDKGVAVYPEQAMQRGIEGYSIVEYEISAQGRVVNPVIIESSPGSIFNRSSLNAVENYLYEPPVFNGENIGVKGLRTRFVYQLNPKPG